MQPRDLGACARELLLCAGLEGLCDALECPIQLDLVLLDALAQRVVGHHLRPERLARERAARCGLTKHLCPLGRDAAPW